MSPTAARLAAEITAALQQSGASVSGLLIGSFGVNMDAASERDAVLAVEVLTKAGAKVAHACLDGQWAVSGDL